MKNTIKHDPFANLILDDEEKALEEAFESGEYQEDPNFEETKRIMAEAAANYLELQKSKPITIRINQLDLIKLKAKAKVSQIPYQTLLGLLVHQYAIGETELSI